MVSNAAVIVLCIVGAGGMSKLTSSNLRRITDVLAALLMMGYAIGTRLWNGSPDDGGDVERGNEFNQAAYMREVRLRNQDKIFSAARTGGAR